MCGGTGEEKGSWREGCVGRAEVWRGRRRVYGNRKTGQMLRLDVVALHADCCVGTWGQLANACWQQCLEEDVAGEACARCGVLGVERAV